MILIVAGVVFIGVPILVALVTTIPMARVVMTPIPNEFSHRVRSKASRVADDAEVAALDFTFESVYELNFGTGRALCVVWRHGRDATYLSAYTTSTLRGRWIVDLFSVLSEQPYLTLTTSTAKAPQSLPLRTGDYKQSFDRVSLAGLWDHHTDAEAHLVDKYGVIPGRVDRLGGEAFQTYLRDSSADRLRRPWVWLAVPYWFWIGRHLKHNRPVASVTRRRP